MKIPRLYGVKMVLRNSCLVTRKAVHAHGPLRSHTSTKVFAEFPKFNLGDQKEIGISQTISKCPSVSTQSLVFVIAPLLSRSCSPRSRCRKHTQRQCDGAWGISHHTLLRLCRHELKR